MKTIKLHKKLSKLLVLVLILLGFNSNLFGQVPANYYDSATPYTDGADLKQKLHDIITSGHTPVSYDGLWTSFQTTDRDDDANYENDASVFDKYSENPSGADPYTYHYTGDQCGSYSGEGSCYNREHSFPKSWWGGSTSDPQYTDLNHLIPTDGYVNGKRSNYAFGETASASWTSQNGCKLGSSSYSGVSGTIFEPIDEFKGDFARMLFYMATRYKDEIPTWYSNNNTDMHLVFQSNGEFQTAYYDMIYAWHQNDPVSAKEDARNDDVYDEQGNANPYIDHPEWVCEVFGTCSVNPEPTNHPTAFTASDISDTQIDLSWTDATGADLPTGYLILANTTNSFTDPVDGTDPATDSDLSDGSAVVKVAHGAKGGYSFTGLNATTQYYFNIYSYANSGANIDFKTDPVIKNDNATTRAPGPGSLTGAGDIAFTAFNADGNDDFAFVALKDIDANTSIWFTDNEWDGTDAFVDLNEGEIEWKHTSLVSAGTVIRIEGNSGGSPTTSLGTVSGSGLNLGASNEGLLALLSQPSTSSMPNPGFLAGIANDLTFSIANTGLTVGTDFLDFNNDHDGFQYTGNRDTESAFADYLPLLMNTANWQDETSNGNNILPIDMTVFTLAGSSPTITVSPSTLTGFSYVVGNGPSSEQSFTCEGSNLTNDISITPPTNYEISTGTGGSFVATNPITLTQSGGTVNSTTIYVRLKASLSVGAYNNEDIACASTGATTQNVTCSGDVTNVPTIVVGDNGTQVAAANVEQGTANHILSTFKLDVTNADATLTQADIYYEGTYVAADIDASGMELWYNSSNDFATATSIKSVNSSGSGGSGEIISFTSLSQAITAGTSGYFWVTADIASGANVGNTINVLAVDNTDLTFSGGNKSGASSAAGDQTITAYTPPNVFISEVAGKGEGGDWNDEYIELINNGASSVDLNGWQLLYYESSLEKTITFGSGDVISPNDAFVIAVRTTHTAAITPDYTPGSSFSLNDPGYVVLKDDGGAIFDEAGSSSDKFAKDINYEFTDCGNDNKPTANWDNLGTSNGTPGVVNCVASNDTDSDVDGPALATQPNITTISSLVDTDAEKLRVFDFDIYDYGTADGLPTHVTQITIKTGANNTADWSTTLGGAKISINGGTSFVTTGAPTINASSIVFPITSGNLDITDGNAETVSLYVYLNTSGITDGDILEFKVDGTSHGFTADASGSTFAGTFTGTTPSPVSNQITIAVVATELRYASNATDANVNECMSPDVTVEATDANGNRDIDFTSDISITSTGSLSTSPIVVTAVSGLATFSGANCIEHTAQATAIHLVAERDGTNDWDVNSADFDITDINACGLEEFDGGSTAPAGWTFTSIGTYTTSGNYGNSSPSLKFDNTGDRVETATVTSPSQLTFWIKGQATDASSALLIEGWDGSWNTVENLTNLPTTGTTKTYNAGLSSYTKFRFTYTKSSGNLAFDDVNVTCGSCTEPTNDAASLTFPTINSTSLDLSWSNGNGGNRIVVCRKGAAVSFTPADNNTYAANSDYSAGTEVGTVGEGNKVIYNGNSNSMSVTGLEPGTIYYFKIFEYGCGVSSEDYFTSGTPSEGNETTLPENVSNFTLTCITNTTAELTWDLPNGSFDGILIAVRESTNAPSDPSCDGSTLSSPDTDFSTALVYCGNGTSSKYVYNATGTTVSITGLTSGADYVFKAFTYKGSNWTSGTQTADVASVKNVTGENTVPADQQVTVSWTNPTTCYDEIMVVVHKGGSVTQTPSGDGSAYTADASEPFSGTNLGSNDMVVYKGTVNNFDATGLTNGTQYCFKIFTRKASDWSSGVEVCETPADVTVFKPGELMIVGFDSNVGGGTDSLFLATLVDIKPGTEFLYVNSRFEAGAAANTRTMEWHGGGDDPNADPGIFRISYSSLASGNIAAGSIISFSTGGNTADNIRVNGTLNTDFSSLNISGSANIHATKGDQIWLLQGTFTDQGNYHTLEGNVLWGLSSRIGWVSISSSVSSSSDGTGRESRLHPDLECFNLEMPSGQEYALYKNQSNHNDSKRNLLLAVMNSTNWLEDPDLGAGDNTMNFDVDYTAPYANDQAGKPFTITASANSEGTWIGGTTSYEKDWFTCKNWEGLTVPDSTMDVTIPSVSDDAPIIDHTSTKAAKYSYYAECNNLLMNDSLSLIASLQDTIFIHGNLTMQGSAVLNLDDGNTGTSDGIVYLFGNYDNQVSGDALKQGNSTFNFVGANEQTINADASETFYNLSLNNTSLEGVQISDNLTVSKIFTHTDGTLDLNGHNLTMSGEYNRTSGDFEGDVASNFTISGSGNLDPIYFADDLNVNEFVMSRNGENASLMTNLTTAGKMAISNGGSVTFNAGKEYTIGGTLSNTTTGNGGVIIKSDASGTASVLQNTGSVRATCERYMQANRWHFLSIPLSSASTSQLNVVSWGDTNPNFYWYDENVADFWQGTTLYTPTGWTNESNSTLDNDKGYIHRAPEARTYELTGGTLEDADYTITLHYTENGGGDDNATESTTGTKWNEFEGWNMIPNEFACAIDWDKVWLALTAAEKTYLEDGIYYLDNADLSEKGGYKFYGSATMHNQGITLNGATKDIPANQTVFIKATPAGDGNTITIPKSARLHGGHDFWKKSVKSLPENAIKLSISKDNKSDETVVRTLENATYDHDYSIDAYKMFAWDNSTPQILTRNDENSRYFGVNSIPLITGPTVIPIVTYVGTAGEYLIKNIENRFVNTHVWLEDRTENNFVKFNSSDDVYTFNQTAETNDNRFYLHFDLNHKPSVNANIPDQVTNKDELYSYSVADNVFTDVDFEDVLTLSATLSNGDALPTWLTFNSETKEFSGTPDAVQVLNIKITATDIFGEYISDEYKLTVKSTISVSDLTEDEVSIYPNPANDVIFVELPSNNKTQVSIVDITGQLLYSSFINSQKSEINLRGFSKGVYFVKVKSLGRVITKKIVIE